AGESGQSNSMRVGTNQQAIGNSNRLKILGFTLCAMLLVLCLPAEAQQPKKIPRLGMLVSGTFSSNESQINAFRQGLRELGYLEGQNIVIEYRYAEGKTDRFPDLAGELIRLKVDVIVTASTPPVLAAKRTSNTIPIVFASVYDPVES